MNDQMFIQKKSLEVCYWIFMNEKKVITYLFCIRVKNNVRELRV